MRWMKRVELGHHYIGTEHILLGLVRVDSTAMEVLRRLGVTAEQIRRQTRRVLNESASSPTPAGGSLARGSAATAAKTPLVDQLATDLTTKAEEKKLDPVIGRQMEIERVIQILARRTKNNPALIGEPGVGKTAIVEGLAQRIVEGDVPAPLMNKRLLQLDVGSLVAGTMYRGQFEERLKRVIDELKQSGAILFIDEVHMLVGAGAAGSSVDAANILKPALSRGELQVIGATTMDEYRKHIESDAALERRFQPITVEEPSEEETIEILKGIRNAYEEHHHLVISDEALEAAAHLSSRYVTERFLPDKAIDLIDESSSRVRMYKSAAAKESKDLFGQLRQARQNRSLAQEEGNSEDVREWEEREVELGEQIERLRTGWDRTTSPVVSAEDIAEVVSMWTGVPLMQLAEARVTAPAQDGRRTAQEHHRSGRRHPGDLACRPPRPRRVERPEAPDWFVHVPRTHRCGQDGTDQDTRQVHVRQRRRSHPTGYVRVHGAAYRLTSGRCPSGIHRL